MGEALALSQHFSIASGNGHAADAVEVEVDGIAASISQTLCRFARLRQILARRDFQAHFHLSLPSALLARAGSLEISRNLLIA